MTRIRRTSRSSNSPSTNSVQVAERDGVQTRPSQVIAVERSGEWKPADELKTLVENALQACGSIAFDLKNLSYIDASALQVLLAAHSQQGRIGHPTHLINLSPDLRHWLEISGATGHLSLEDGETF